MQQTTIRPANGTGREVNPVRWKKAARVALPIIIALALIAGLSLNAVHSRAVSPRAQNGVLNLAEWDRKSAFPITGEWEFYWGRLLSAAQIKQGHEARSVVEAPGGWDYYETEWGKLPSFGRATYRVHVRGAEPGEEYGVRFQNMASPYRLYMDEALIAQNGTFGDKIDAPVSEYRTQLAAFKPLADNFDLILQMSNDTYPLGGMWQPIIFGTAGQVTGFDRLLSGIVTASMAAILVMCLFFCIFFAAQRREKDIIILAGIGALLLIRLTMYGDMLVTYLFPDMPASGFGWIDFFSLIWIQFLLYYFVYCAYGGLVRRGQLIALFSYCALVSLGVILLPFEVFMSTASILNIILLFVISVLTVQLALAAWRGQPGAPALFGALAFILLSYLSCFVFPVDYSLGAFLVAGSSVQYIILFAVQCYIIARRYKRAQQLEISFLKGQLHPHFIHNSLTGIITLARTDPGRTRGLLQNLSSYLRGFYDFEGDDLIPLRQELEFVRAYASLEQMRFGEKVCLEYQIQSEDLLLPSLILQPLVENAFVHGLREKEEGGTVVIYAQKTKAGKARVGVRDNGLGFGAKPSVLGRRGVAIENINHRLARLYRTQLVFTVPEGGGCEVYMEIPWKEAAIQENESIPG